MKSGSGETTAATGHCFLSLKSFFFSLLFFLVVFFLPGMVGEACVLRKDGLLSLSRGFFLSQMQHKMSPSCRLSPQPEPPSACGLSPHAEPIVNLLWDPPPQTGSGGIDPKPVCTGTNMLSTLAAIRYCPHQLLGSPAP